MQRLDTIAEQIHQAFEARTKARDEVLSQARTLTRYCATAIRAVHRDEFDVAQENLDLASSIANSFQTDLVKYPDLYYAGYTQDALKEYAEASIVFALVINKELPSPQELGLENAAYLTAWLKRLENFGADAWTFSARVIPGMQSAY